MPSPPEAVYDSCLVQYLEENCKSGTGQFFTMLIFIVRTIWSLKVMVLWMSLSQVVFLTLQRKRINQPAEIYMLPCPDIQACTLTASSLSSVVCSTDLTLEWITLTSEGAYLKISFPCPLLVYWQLQKENQNRQYDWLQGMVLFFILLLFPFLSSSLNESISYTYLMWWDKSWGREMQILIELKVLFHVIHI